MTCDRVSEQVVDLYVVASLVLCTCSSVGSFTPDFLILVQGGTHAESPSLGIRDQVMGLCFLSQMIACMFSSYFTMHCLEACGRLFFALWSLILFVDIIVVCIITVHGFDGIGTYIAAFHDSSLVWDFLSVLVVLFCIVVAMRMSRWFVATFRRFVSAAIVVFDFDDCPDDGGWYQDEQDTWHESSDAAFGDSDNTGVADESSWGDHDGCPGGGL